MRILQILAIAILSVGLVGPYQASAETLTLGSISDNAKKHLARYGRLAEYLESEMSDDGITEVTVLVLPTSDDMAQALKDGRVDLFSTAPWSLQKSLGCLTASPSFAGGNEALAPTIL